MLLAHVNASTNLSNDTSLTLLMPTLSGCISSRYHLCDVLLLHMFFLSAPSLIPFLPSSPFPSFLSSFSSPLFVFVSSVRRGPVLFTSLSPQARVILCLQPPPETRVQSLGPAQPSPALFFLQHWALPRHFVLHHRSK